jgi:hypothetical protein
VAVSTNIKTVIVHTKRTLANRRMADRTSHKKETKATRPPHELGRRTEMNRDAAYDEQQAEYVPCYSPNWPFATIELEFLRAWFGPLWWFLAAASGVKENTPRRRSLAGSGREDYHSKTGVGGIATGPKGRPRPTRTAGSYPLRVFFASRRACWRRPRADTCPATLVPMPVFASRPWLALVFTLR